MAWPWSTILWHSQPCECAYQSHEDVTILQECGVGWGSVVIALFPYSLLPKILKLISLGGLDHVPPSTQLSRSSKRFKCFPHNVWIIYKFDNKVSTLLCQWSPFGIKNHEAIFMFFLTMTLKSNHYLFSFSFNLFYYFRIIIRTCLSTTKMTS